MSFLEERDTDVISAKFAEAKMMAENHPPLETIPNKKISYNEATGKNDILIPNGSGGHIIVGEAPEDRSKEIQGYAHILKDMPFDIKDYEAAGYTLEEVEKAGVIPTGQQKTGRTEPLRPGEELLVTRSGGDLAKPPSQETLPVVSQNVANEAIAEFTKALVRGGVVKPTKFLEDNFGIYNPLRLQIINPDTGEFDLDFKILSFDEVMQERDENKGKQFFFDIEELVSENEDASAVAGLAGGFGQFLGAYVGLAKYFKFGQTLMAQGFTRGAAADFLAFEGNEGRLTDLLVQLGVDEKFIPSFLVTDPNDPDYIGRFKTALEGGHLGVLTEGLLRGVGKVFRAIKDRDVPAEEVTQITQDSKRSIKQIIIDRLNQPGEMPTVGSNLGNVGQGPNQPSQMPVNLDTSKTLYHGTDNEFESFETGRSGLIYLAETPNLASEYGSKVTAYNIDPGKQFDVVDNPEHRKQMIEMFNDRGGWQGRDIESGREGSLYDARYDNDWEILDNLDTDILTDLKKEGYESFRFYEDNDRGLIAVALTDPSKVMQKKISTGDPKLITDPVLRAGGEATPPKAENITLGEASETPMVSQLAPEYRVTLNGVQPGGTGKQSFIPKAMTPGNFSRASTNLDTISQEFTDPLSSPENYALMMGSVQNSIEVPAPPKWMIEHANDMDKWSDWFGGLTDTQIKAANEGLAVQNSFKQAYSAGADTELTGQLMLWSILSRRLSAFPHESGYLDLAQAATPYIQKAARGEWSDADTSNWLEMVKTTIPAGTPGKSATSNANDFGKVFLKKMAAVDEEGVSALTRLHQMIADPNMSSAQIRRAYYGLAEDTGIANKILSFALLVSGRNDVVVLDRIQINRMWAGGDKIYDDVYKQFEGAQGLAQYEALERSLQNRVQTLYEKVGRGDKGSVGRYHWESWVLSSGQVVSHPTLETVVKTGAPDPKRNIPPTASTPVMEGRFNKWYSGVQYEQMPDGSNRYIYKTSDGTPFQFTKKSLDDMLNKVKKKSSGVLPSDFPGVTSFEGGNMPWYEYDGVDRGKIDKFIREAGKPIS